MDRDNTLTDVLIDVLIVGAGPAGLACAIEAKKRGLRCLVVDRGSLCNSVRRFPVNMTFFSTCELLELDNIPFSCTRARPSRSEVLNYYRLVAERSAIPLRLYCQVDSITKLDSQHFEVRTSGGVYTCKYVVIATGYFDNVNRLDVPGEDLKHVHTYYTEASVYTGCNVLVVGAKNSAVETSLDLWRNGAWVTLVHRGAALAESVKYWQKPDMENRIKNGEITAHFNSTVAEIREREVDIVDSITGKRHTLKADFVIKHIGYRPDVELLKRCGVGFDPETLIPIFDPATFETNVSGLFVAGSVMCGCKSWNIFIENGREHGKTIIGVIKQVCSIVPLGIS